MTLVLVEEKTDKTSIMFTSFEEFKFFQSFRIPIESCDEIQFILSGQNKFGKI